MNTDNSNNPPAAPESGKPVLRCIVTSGKLELEERADQRRQEEGPVDDLYERLVMDLSIARSNHPNLPFEVMREYDVPENLLTWNDHCEIEAIHRFNNILNLDGEYRRPAVYIIFTSNDGKKERCSIKLKSSDPQLFETNPGNKIFTEDKPAGNRLTGDQIADGFSAAMAEYLRQTYIQKKQRMTEKVERDTRSSMQRTAWWVGGGTLAALAVAFSLAHCHGHQPEQKAASQVTKPETTPPHQTFDN